MAKKKNQGVASGPWYTLEVTEPHPNGGTVQSFWIMSKGLGVRVALVSGVNLSYTEAKATAEFIAKKRYV